MEQRIIKQYEQFVQKIKGDAVNEAGFFGKALDFLANAYNYVRAKFGKGSWLYWALYLDKKGELDKSKVEVFSYSMSASQRKEFDEMMSATSFKEDLEKAGPESAEAEKMEKPIEDGFSWKGLISKYLKTNEGAVKLEHPSPNVVNYNANQLKKLIIDKFNMRVKKGDTQPIWIWGAPGIGKTDIVKQAANELGCELIVFHLSVVEPADFMGVPGTEEVKGIKRTVFMLPKIFPTDNGPNDKGVILFFDEMNRASKPVLAASLGLVLDGKLNQYSIPTKCLVLAAGNRKEEVPSVEEIEPALGNRFAHVNLVTTFDDWEKWAMTLGKDDVHPDIYAFLTVRKEFFHQLDPDVDSPAWPSPRSWVKASQHYIQATDNGKRDISKKDIIDIFALYLGNGPATEFANFVEMKKEFDPKDIEKVYKDGDKAPLPKMDRMDKAIAVLSAIAFYKRDIELTDDEIKNIFKYALRFDEVELATAFLGLTKLVHPYLPKNKTYIDGIKDFHTKFQKDLPSAAPTGTRKKKPE